MSLDTTTRGLASRMLARFGRTITYRVTDFEPDPDTGIPDPDDAVETVLKGLVTPYRVTETDGVLVQAGDHKVLLAASDLDAASITPKQGDQVLIGSETASVVGFQKVTGGGELDALVRLQVRS